MKTLVYVLFFLPLISCSQVVLPGGKGNSNAPKPGTGKPAPDRADIMDRNIADLKKRFEAKAGSDSLDKIFLNAEIKVLKDSLESFRMLTYRPPLYAIPEKDGSGKIIGYEIIYSNTPPISKDTLQPIPAPKPN